MTVSTFRELTSEERALLDRLLGEPFPGRDEIKSQLSRAQVRSTDADGSLETRPQSGARAKVVHRIPVEATYSDVDGIPVQILLHVVDGKVSELEIYKVDGSAIQRRPSASELNVSHANASGEQP
jgi:hypothetical protein